MVGWPKGKSRVPMSEGHKQKISDAAKGHLRPKSKEHRQKLSDANKGQVPWNKGKTLSEEHKRKIGDARKGEKSHLWKGGITPENRRIRTSTEYREWREAVFERDNYTCQACGRRGGALHPHHILPFATYPEARFLVANGQTLCKECHMHLHKAVRIRV